ncbi:MAG: ATP-binding cassette domain-containing protein [Acidipropionibacterium sp.]|jgi:putative ABC transport system ATP-binding protein|nr:ATP-binding cassette domain-containing protein [Acidipropionibacterium sp.]
MTAPTTEAVSQPAGTVRLKEAPFTLTAAHITKSFGSRTLWGGLSFTVESGTMTAVTGPSGSGKTTLLNCIGLLEGFDAGRIGIGPWTFTGGPRHRLGGRERACQHNVLGFLFQNYGLVENWNVRRNLTVPLRHRKGLSAAARSAMIDQALERVGLPSAQHTMIYTLSRGERQRVALARLILKEPSVILADEPTSALDHSDRDLVLRTLQEQADDGAVVLIATHSDHVIEHCTRHIGLRQGETPASPRSAQSKMVPITPDTP